MARSRFRSQPALQRSGGRGAIGLLGFALVIVAAAGGGVVVSTAMRSLDDWANAPRTRVERVARNGPVVRPPATLPSDQPQAVEIAVREPAPEREVTVARFTAPRTPKPSKPLLPDLGALKPRWEQQQQEYLLARDAYDASERAEGFRWAQQYKVRTRRYCRELERQRTAAFMEGCLNYAAGSRPRAPAGAGQEDPG